MPTAKIETNLLSMHPRIIRGFHKQLFMLRMWLDVTFFFVKKYKNPWRIVKIIKRINALKNQFTVENEFKKLAFVDGRVFFNNSMVGWPAKHFKSSLNIEARTAINGQVTNLENLRMVQIAFTKKCPLNCEHCYEAAELNKKDSLTLDDHKKIILKLQNAGIPVIQFGGGDPMSKVNDLVELLETSKKTTDFWIYTSGFNLDFKNALRLKKAGLTGVSISLDHHVPEKHNQFRRNNKAFDWVLEGAESTIKAKLVLTLTICVTKDYCSKENLFRYLLLAKKMGASFVQLFEPRAVGNYAGQDVNLSSFQLKILGEFFLEMNNSTIQKDMPIILYPGYHQRKNGCPGAGSKYLYIDTDGYMSSCPFCRNTKSHILENEHEHAIQEMKLEGCELVDQLR